MRNDTRLGIGLMVLTTLIFAAQDGISRHLAGEYNVIMVVMVRYWFFALFAIWLARRTGGSIRAVAASSQLVLQILRGVLLAAEICVMVAAFVLLGLVESHAIFVSYPLVVAALSGPVLGEKVGWMRWSAIAMGFVGVLVILRPGFGVFSPYALVAVCAASMFALYALLTRYVARKDEAITSFFWTGVAGAVFMTVWGIFWWEAMTPVDWVWMLLLCITGASGHFTLIKCYEVAEASAVQPFAYLQMPFASAIGIAVFGEVLEWPVAVGAGIVIGAGLFAWWRERQRGKAAKPAG